MGLSPCPNKNVVIAFHLTTLVAWLQTQRACGSMTPNVSKVSFELSVVAG